MIKIITRNIFRFIFLILLQVWVLNNIQFSGYVNPYMYILFILLLPFETPKSIVLILAFFMGISIDMFSDTIGMHTSATILIAFLRPYVLQAIAPRDGYESGSFPRVFYYGLGWFFKYTVILVLIHHLFLFFIETFNFTNIFLTIGRSILSVILSTIFIITSQYVVFRK